MIIPDRNIILLFSFFIHKNPLEFKHNNYNIFYYIIRCDSYDITLFGGICIKLFSEILCFFDVYNQIEYNDYVCDEKTNKESFMKKDKDIFDRIMEWKILSIFNPFYKKYKEVLLYLFFGGLTTFISIGSYAFFDISMHMDPMIANIFSWILAVLFAYVTNRIWVFDSNAEGMKGIIQEMVSFFGGRVATLLMEEVILYVGINLLSMNSIGVKVAAQILVLVGNYLISKLFVFKS